MLVRKQAVPDSRCRHSAVGGQQETEKLVVTVLSRLLIAER